MVGYGIATPRQVGARNDKREMAQNGATFSIAKERIPSRLDLPLRGTRFLAYARNRLRNLVVGLGRAGWFILGAEASSADIDFLLAPFYHNCCAMNIREPFSIGTSFGMTYTVPKLSSFTANLALHRNFSIW